MITRIAGVLNRVLDEEVRIQVGPMEYQVLVPEFIRRALQLKLGKEVTFHTSHYFDGNPMQGKVVPRLLGFSVEAELDFFELFCTVDKVGTKKALKAMVRPVKDIADAIQRKDVKWLTTLPGIGAATAEKIIATLHRKVTRFALMPTKPAAVAPASGEGVAPVAVVTAEEPVAEAAAVMDGNVLEDAYQALMAVGHGPQEARARLDKVLLSGKTFSSVEEVLQEIYNTR